MWKRFAIGVTAGLVIFLTISRAEAQLPSGRCEVGARLTTLAQNDFHDLNNKTDYGVGGQLSYDLTDFVAVEGDVSLFPQNLGGFSRRRTEGLLGVKVGTRGAGASFFGILKSGFVKFGPSPEPLGCILIYPPPLECTLASGQREFAVAMGGGVAVPFANRLRGRLEIADTLIRFKDPAIRNGRPVSEFTSHHLQVNVGLGLRF
jgi:hypothetical protein